jgi:hypothetical protein
LDPDKELKRILITAFKVWAAAEKCGGRRGGVKV